MTRAEHPLADVLSITTGLLLSRDGMAGVHRILDAMTGDALMTHQLPRAMDACQPALRAQHPQLAGVVPPQGIDPADLTAWLTDAEQRFGTEMPVTPLDVWAHRDPVEEACDMFGTERVYVAVLPEEVAS